MTIKTISTTNVRMSLTSPNCRFILVSETERVRLSLNVASTRPLPAVSRQKLATILALSLTLGAINAKSIQNMKLRPLPRNVTIGREIDGGQPSTWKQLLSVLLAMVNR